MSDLFTNLAAQTLSSSVELQPLLPPVFAPASQLSSDAALLPSEDQPAVAIEIAPFSSSSSLFAGEMTDVPDMEQRVEESEFSEEQPILPDLVPAYVQQNSISTLSLHRLLHPVHEVQADMEAVAPPFLATINEPLLEDMQAPPFSDAEASRTRAILASLPPSSADRPVRTHEIAQADAIPNTPEIQPSFTLGEDTVPTVEDSLHTASAKGDAARTVREVYLSTLESEASRSYMIPPAADRPVAPLPVQPVSLASPSPSQPSAQAAPPVRFDDLSEDQQFSLAVHPTAKPALSPLHGDGRIVTNADVAMPEPQKLVDRQNKWTGRNLVSPSVSRPASSLREDPVAPIGNPGRTPSQPRYSLKKALAAPAATHPARPAAVSPVIPSRSNIDEEPSDSLPGSQFIAPGSSARRERVSITSSSASAAPDMLYAPPALPVQEAPLAKAEVPPVRITIGRVVVRATPAAQPTSTRKRVLRPAQSLSEYLKQREKGSR